MFPAATGVDKKAGWKIDLKFLQSIQREIGDKAEQDGSHRDSVCYPSPEEIESILLAAYEVSTRNKMPDNELREIAESLLSHCGLTEYKASVGKMSGDRLMVCVYPEWKHCAKDIPEQWQGMSVGWQVVEHLTAGPARQK